MIIVSKNNTHPNANNALKCIPPCGASPNSAAMVAGMVLTGTKIECGITAAFPVTINTAIVSPIALPIPRIAAAVIPEIE